MATQKDLAEAYAFNRRRLITAFVSGAPGGREVEPVRRGWTLVGGLALAALLVAVAAIAGVVLPTLDEKWAGQPRLINSPAAGVGRPAAPPCPTAPREPGSTRVRMES